MVRYAASFTGSKAVADVSQSWDLSDADYQVVIDYLVTRRGGLPGATSLSPENAIAKWQQDQLSALLATVKADLIQAQVRELQTTVGPKATGVSVIDVPPPFGRRGPPVGATGATGRPA